MLDRVDALRGTCRASRPHRDTAACARESRRGPFAPSRDARWHRPSDAGRDRGFGRARAAKRRDRRAVRHDSRIGRRIERQERGMDVERLRKAFEERGREQDASSPASRIELGFVARDAVGQAARRNRRATPPRGPTRSPAAAMPASRARSQHARARVVRDHRDDIERAVASLHVVDHRLRVRPFARREDDRARRTAARSRTESATCAAARSSYDAMSRSPLTAGISAQPKVARRDRRARRPAAPARARSCDAPARRRTGRRSRHRRVCDTRCSQWNERSCEPKAGEPAIVPSAATAYHAEPSRTSLDHQLGANSQSIQATSARPARRCAAAGNRAARRSPAPRRERSGTDSASPSGGEQVDGQR